MSAQHHRLFLSTHSDVKLIQTIMLCHELKRMCDEANQSFRPGGQTSAGTAECHKLPLVLCGDFNSLPDSGEYCIVVQNDQAFLQQVRETFSATRVFGFSIIKQPVASSKSFVLTGMTHQGCCPKHDTILPGFYSGIAMSNPRPAGRMSPNRRFCAAQFRFSLK